MHENFIALDKGKRDRIINAAIREFSEKGYKNASTNEIVKKASISKGALFHYFSSKQELFEFLYRYCIDFLMQKLEPNIKDMPADLFERWIAFAAIKIEIALQYPDMADFMQKVYRDNTHESSGLMRKEFERFSVAFQDKIYEGIDYSKFKPDLDIKKVTQMIWWVLEGFVVLKQKEPFDLQKANGNKFLKSLISEINSYLYLLKSSFYRSDYLE